MKVPEARLMRMSEGICPACDVPLARGREEGICNCCGYSYRLRDSKIEGRHRSDWLPDIELPRGCGDGIGEVQLDNGAVLSVTRVHVFHLALPDETYASC